MKQSIYDQVKSQGARLVYKKGWFWSALHWILLIVTFGCNRSFKTKFVTTIGPVIGIPTTWNIDAIEWWREPTIRHELVHVDQFKKAGFGSAWVGVLPMFVWYVLLPLPVFFAWGRWVSERSAYLVNLRFARDVGDALPIDRIVGNLTGGAYGWALPPLGWFRRYAENWFLRHLNDDLADNDQ